MNNNREREWSYHSFLVSGIYRNMKIQGLWVVCVKVIIIYDKVINDLFNKDHEKYLCFVLQLKKNCQFCVKDQGRTKELNENRSVV